MIDLTVQPDDGERVTFTATSRDILQWERAGKGRSFSALMEHLAIGDLFEIAWHHMRRQQFIDASLPLRDFERSHEVIFDGESEPADPTPPVPSAVSPSRSRSKPASRRASGSARVR